VKLHSSLSLSLSLARVPSRARERTFADFSAKLFEPVNFSVGADRSPANRSPAHGGCDVRHGVLNFTRRHAHTLRLPLSTSCRSFKNCTDSREICRHNHRGEGWCDLDCAIRSDYKSLFDDPLGHDPDSRTDRCVLARVHSARESRVEPRGAPPTD